MAVGYVNINLVLQTAANMVVQLVSEARSEASQYRSFYGVPISPKVTMKSSPSTEPCPASQRTIGRIHAPLHSQRWRPTQWLLVSALLFPPGSQRHSILSGGYDKVNGPELFMAEPSGLAFVSNSDTFLLTDLLSRATTAAQWAKPSRMLKLNWRSSNSLR